MPHFRSKARTLKEAQAGEHAGDDALKFYTEREWPECDVIVGNPPFLGGSKMIRELGENYVSQMREIYDGRVPGGADLVCYWFAKAWDQLAAGKSLRAGLVATNAIRKGANRKVLDSIVSGGFIFEAWSDRPWILEGAAVRVAFVCFSKTKSANVLLNGEKASRINADLTEGGENHKTNLTEARQLEANANYSFQGSQKIGDFDISLEQARKWLHEPNPHGLPNSDVLKPSWNGIDLTRRPRDGWIIDFGTEISEERAALYELPFNYVLANVKPEREQNNREAYGKYWWRHGEPRVAMRAHLSVLPRYIATAEVAKHRSFVWLPLSILPDKRLIVFAREDDFAFGILHSRFHEVWSLHLGSTLEDRPCYRPTTCFETFPFPFPDDLEEPLDNTEAALNSAKFYSHITLHEEPVPYRISAAKRGVHAASTSKLQATPKRPQGRALLTRDEHRAAIADAAEELNALRERWLNPPEWTVEKILEFPGSVDGPWARYLVPSTINSQLATGLVRYPRLEPRDADCAAKLQARTLTKLYNERPAWLDLAHQKLDAAVAAAYGFPADLTDEQVLEKLLALNLERAAEEAKVAKVKKPKAQRVKLADEFV